MTMALWLWTEVIGLSAGAIWLRTKVIGLVLLMFVLEIATVDALSSALALLAFALPAVASSNEADKITVDRRSWLVLGILVS